MPRDLFAEKTLTTKPQDLFEQGPRDLFAGLTPEKTDAQVERDASTVLGAAERGGLRLQQTFAASGMPIMKPDAVSEILDRGKRKEAGEELEPFQMLEEPEKATRRYQKEIAEIPQHPVMPRAIEAASQAWEDGNAITGAPAAVAAFIKEFHDSPDTLGATVETLTELAPQIVTFLSASKTAVPAGQKIATWLLKSKKTKPTTALRLGQATQLGLGGGASSGLNTFGPNVAENLEKGLNFDQAKARARVQTLAQGGVDALTSAILPWKIGPNQWTNISAQAVVQAMGGATGEMARSYAVGDTPIPGEVVAEGLLEMLGLPADLVVAGTVKVKDVLMPQVDEDKKPSDQRTPTEPREGVDLLEPDRIRVIRLGNSGLEGFP
jgi:hypothetical protein